MSLDERITVRISKQDKDILQQRAADLNIKLNKLIRLKLIHVPVEPSLTIVSANFESCQHLNSIDFQLRKIGANINQLAHNANLSMQMGSPMQSDIKKLSEMFDAIEETRRVVLDTYNQINPTKVTAYK
ncbi:MAG: plasmid mobilization relaxosome protein MobC [Pseudanabaenaceae cyanobacterium bins.39]|nr:plasmid mobilization relaxosome protein MobC [Pseudanabaenaceae cyanobacterium bins.39]